jgi:hypothetical protein
VSWSFHSLQSYIERRKEVRFERVTPVPSEEGQLTTARTWTWSAVLSPLLPLTGVVLLWAASLSIVDLSRMDDLGLVSTLPLWTFVALFVLTACFSLFVYRRDTPEALLLLYVVVFIVMLHGTPQILYGTLRYSWAWKHVGIVDYIQRHGTVDPYIAYLAAYHNWPGFFAFNALITEVSGVKTALAYAGWAPVFFNLLSLGAVRFILRTLTKDRRLIWLSLWLFFLANWVGQDYFSPQAMTYFLYLVVIGILLRWFRVMHVPDKSAIRRWVRAEQAARLVHGLLARALPDKETAPTVSPLDRVGLMAIVILCLVAMASSHQLMPLMAISALTTLVVFQVCTARGLPVLMAVLTVAWIIYMATAFLQGNLFWIVDSVGLLLGNFRANLVNLAEVSRGQAFVALMDRSLSAGIWGVAILGAIRRLLFGHWDLPAVLLALAPFPLLVTNSYGGEMVFRVYFYGIPFAAFFAGSLFYPHRTSGSSWRTPVATVVLTCALLVGFLFAYYGKDRQYYFQQAEVDAAEYVGAAAPAGALLIDGSWDWPLQYKHYEFYQYESLAALPLAERRALIKDPVGSLVDLMRPYPEAYLTITRSQKAHIDMTGLLPAGTLDDIEHVLLGSPRFDVVYRNADATVFTLARGPDGEVK